MLAIYKKELRSYFHSFIGLLFIGVSLFFIGLYYLVYCLMYGYPYFSYVINSVIVLFMLTVPVLTMRIMAEERRSKTDQLILTAPITVGQIVMGKFLALVTILAVPTLISAFYPLILLKFGSVPLGESYLALLAFFLYGMVSIAIGILVSSLTESQVIAAVLGFVLLFVGYMMPSLCSLISSSGNWLTNILSLYDLYTPFVLLLNGTLDVGSVVYYVSLTALVLFLTTQSIQKRRYSVSVKTLKTGAYSSGMIVAALAITIVVNLLVGQLPSTWTSLDLTSNKLYSLTDQTKEFLEGMDEDVTIYVLVSEENEDSMLGQTLDRYEAMSEHVTVQYVDPIQNPLFYSQYTSSSVSTNSLIVVSDKRSKVIDANDIYVTSYDYSSYSSSVTGYDGEGQITSALDYVLSDDIPLVYMTEGHGELSLSSSFESSLDKENVEYSTINLMDYEAVPESAACLVINAPSSDLSEDDKDKVIAYLEQGGKVILIVGYREVETPNLDAVLAYMDLSIAEGLVVEEDQSNYYQSPFYVLPTVVASAYTSGIYGNYYIFAPYSQGILVPETEDDSDVSYTTLLTTSSSAYSMRNFESATEFGRQEGDAEGPFALGVEAVKTLDEGEATMVVYSSDQMFTDTASQMVGGSNQMLFTNTVSHFVDHETSVSIPVKDYEVSTLMLSSSNILVLGMITVIILPVGSLVIGFVIWFRRRKK
ncbi:MAG: Gldg family protein [Lachnospiraceae bacterium]|nr:Gldg family protein [Lachnospiraceae bacterium]